MMNLTETMNLANLLRAYHGADLTRMQLKVLRARLRRAGVTRLHKNVRGPYVVAPTSDAVLDTRADDGTVVAQVASMARHLAA